MIVVCLSDCPPKLRGDLTKWLAEINTGVYVGNLSARVRDELWERICKNLKDGRATMVFSAPGEQKMAFRVYNSPWEPVDLDGITLMRRPLPNAAPTAQLPKNFSHAAHRQMQKRREAGTQKAADEYYAVALTAAGESPKAEDISEIAAMRVEDGEICERILFKIAAGENGAELSEALTAFLQFIGTHKIVLYDAAAAFPYLRAACQACGQPILRNPITNVLLLVRRRLPNVRDLSLAAAAELLELTLPDTLDAESICELTAQIYEKLKK